MNHKTATSFDKFQTKPPLSQPKNYVPMMRQLFFIIFCGISFIQLQAQSWTKTYGNNYTSLGNAAVATSDGGFAIVGYREGIGGGKSQLQLLKVDVTGKEQWLRGFGGNDIDLGFDIKETSDKGFILSGSSYVDATKLQQFYLVRTNSNGDEIWSRTFGANAADDKAYTVQPLANGDFLVAGSTQDVSTSNTDAVLYYLDTNGNIQWSVPFGGAGIQEFKQVIVVSDGYVCVGSSVVGKNSKGQDNRDALLVKFSKTGQILWSKTYGTEAYEDAQSIIQLASGHFVFCGKDTSDAIVTRTDKDGVLQWTKKFGNENEDEANAILQSKDGNIIIAGSTSVSTTNIDGLALKLNQNGDVIWQRNIGSSQRFESFSHVTAAKDGSLFFTGVWGSDIFLITSKTYAVKTESTGVLGNNYVKGKVYYDTNNNCKFDNGDTPLNDWLVQITKNNRTYLSISNGSGDISTTVDSGNYVIKLLPQNSYWKQVCQTSYNIALTEQEDTVTVDFALRPVVLCPALEVNISTAQLLRCQHNRYNVSFCNRGTVTAVNAYIDVTFDEFFEGFIVGLPNWTQNGQKIRCNIGDIPAGGCGSFDITALLDENCNKTVLGQAHKVEAHIYPDQICTAQNANWDGSSLEVSGQCVGNQIQFKVRNNSTKKQTQARKAIIIEDDIVYLQKPIGPLDPQQDTTILLPSTGSTYRLIVEQSAGHPGNSNPTVAVEGCATGAFSTGYVTQFSEDDGNPFISTSVQESRGKNNTNEKIAFPKGYQKERYVTDSTEITYQIFFNNTYGDTLKNLTIIDTLSSLVNPTTIKDVQSSHKYKLTFPQNNVLQFDFNDINLPDSSTNALRSSGYVKFRLSQKPNNVNGSQIHNRAAIFYAGKQQVSTNLVTHTVGKNLFTYVKNINENPNIKLNISPNPFVDVTTLALVGLNEVLTPNAEKELLVFNLAGRLVRREVFSTNQITFERQQLMAGMYIFKISQKSNILFTGKLMINN